MPSAFTVPAELLIKKLAEELKSQGDKFSPPEWSTFVKLGVSRENRPMFGHEDWWFVRTASILRKIYIKGPIGVQHLRKEYGGRKNRGKKPMKTFRGSGSIIRKSLQQLEKTGYLAQQGKKGRIITAEGRSFVDKVALEIQKNISDLSHY